MEKPLTASPRGPSHGALSGGHTPFLVPNRNEERRCPFIVNRPSASRWVAFPLLLKPQTCRASPQRHRSVKPVQPIGQPGNRPVEARTGDSKFQKRFGERSSVAEQGKAQTPSTGAER